MSATFFVLGSSTTLVFKSQGCVPRTSEMNPIFGRRASGYFDVRTLSGTKLSPAIHAKKLTLLEKRKTYLTELRKQNGASSPV